MAKITTLYEDREMQNALYPRTKVEAISNDDNEGLQYLLDEKQNRLVSGSNIKTINNESLLGEGNIDLSVGYGIDGANVLCKINSSGGATAEYEATEDCVVWLKNGTSGKIYVDNEAVMSDSGNPSDGFWLPIKKGSIASVRGGSGVNKVWAWGLKK